jgi:small GTP-binding protein
MLLLYSVQEPTIGAAFLTQSLALPSGNVNFQIWDTAGQERYHSLAPMYYRDARAAVVVYDITNSDSFATAQKWVRELKQRGSSDVLIALTGNKIDLAEQRAVSREDALAWSNDNGCLFFEASAKTGENIQELFKTIAEQLPVQEAPISSRSFPVIPPPSQQKNNSGGCC